MNVTDSKCLDLAAENDRLREAVEQSQALLERMVAWTQGEAEFSDGDLATCINAVLEMQATALEERP